MEDPLLTELMGSVNGFLSALVTRVRNGFYQVFTAAGPIAPGLMKEWYGTATAVNGVFTLNISSAGFTQILHVDPQAIYNAVSPNDQVFASINTISLTSVTGRVVKGASDIFKGDALIFAPNCSVMVKVTGR